MISGGRGLAGSRSKMPCEGCGVQFSVFKRKRVCGECERYYCSGCLRRGGGAMCAPCRLLCARPLQRLAIAHLKVRDLQCFLQRQNVSTRGCVEKEELVSLCVSHVNSAAYHRRGGGAAGGARPPAGAFSLKGFTNNINEFITSAFDLRPPAPAAHPAHPPPPPPAPQTRSGCCNATHVHIVIPTSQPCSHTQIRHERFSVTPGGERDVRISMEEAGADADAGAGAGAGVAGGAPSGDSPRVESADCFEIEDVDEAGWEFVTRPADPLPNDSEVLLSATESAAPPAARAPAPRPRTSLARDLLDPALSVGEAGVARAASELELRRSGSGSGSGGDSASLRDEPLMDRPDPADNGAAAAAAAAAAVSLESVGSAAQLERLSVRQLKQLLARNRVEFRGCLERAELLARARMLYRDHVAYREELDKLPMEECCKICMAAPLECVLLECGHIAACTACARQLAECPICRQYVVRAVRFFRS